jgi:hypothetical protein
LPEQVTLDLSEVAILLGALEEYLEGEGHV